MGTWLLTTLLLCGVVAVAHAGWVDGAGEWRISTDAEGFVPLPLPWSAAIVRVTGDFNGWVVTVRERTNHPDGTFSLVGGQVFGGTVLGVPGLLYADEHMTHVNPTTGEASEVIHFRQGFDGLHGVHGTVFPEGRGSGTWTGRIHVPWKTP
jgi:hypothetical protein